MLNNTFDSTIQVSYNLNNARVSFACHTRITRLCSACRACVIFYRRLHMHLKSLIDMQAHTHAVFSHAATRKRSFFTRDNMLTYSYTLHLIIFNLACSLFTFFLRRLNIELSHAYKAKCYSC